MTHTDVLAKSIQKTNIWIKDAAEELQWRNRQKAFTALRAVLHALRDRITNKEAVQLGAQLPAFIRGIYYEGWTLRDSPVRDKTRYGFLSDIQKGFGKVGPILDTVHIAHAIFRLLNEKISQGEIDDIHAVLPKMLNEFWPVEPVQPKIAAGSRQAGVAAKSKSGRARSEHTVNELLASSGPRGRAVSGLVRTLRALNEGQAWRILYGEKLRLSGYECPRCAALFAAERESCGYCGSPLKRARNFLVRIIEFARERGIEIQEVRGDDATVIAARAGGIGAFLKTGRSSNRRVESSRPGIYAA